MSSGDEDTSVKDAYTYKIVSKAEQKQINKKVKNYDKNDVFKVHEILLKKLGAGVSMYLCRVSLILRDIRNYIRKPISPNVCRHLVLKSIHGVLINYKKVFPTGILCCTKCGLETYESLDLDEELHKLIINYFKIANQYAWYLKLNFRVEIKKLEVLLTIDKLLLVDLKNAARNLGISGFSTLRKADLKAVVFKYCTN